jgi:hypothetical protein
MTRSISFFAIVALAAPCACSSSSSSEAAGGDSAVSDVQTQDSAPSDSRATDSSLTDSSIGDAPPTDSGIDVPTETPSETSTETSTETSSETSGETSGDSGPVTCSSGFGSPGADCAYGVGSCSDGHDYSVSCTAGTCSCRKDGAPTGVTGPSSGFCPDPTTAKMNALCGFDVS